MFDLRPAGYVIGLLLMVLGLTMVIPMGLDWIDESTNWISFALSSFITLLIGSVVCLSCQNRIKVNLNIQLSIIEVIDSCRKQNKLLSIV